MAEKPMLNTVVSKHSASIKVYTNRLQLSECKIAINISIAKAALSSSVLCDNFHAVPPTLLL